MSGDAPARPGDDALAVAFASGLPFAGLRDHEHDPALDRVVPPEAARAARVVPLAADDERVRLAAVTAEPDLSAVVAYLGERRVELAIAAAGEIEAILGAPPAPAEVAAAKPDPPPEPPPEPAPPVELDERPGLVPQPRRPRAVMLVVLAVLLVALAAAYLLAR